MNQSANLAAASADLRVVPTMRDLEDSWRRCCKRLRAELGEDVFSSWFGRLAIDSLEGGRAHFFVPTRFLKSWIESHYQERILAALEAEIGGVASISICVRSSTSAPGPQSGPSAAPSNNPKAIDGNRAAALRAPTPGIAAPRVGAKNDNGGHGEALAGSPLDRRLSFASFIVGRSNQLAYSAAQRVVEGRCGEPPAFSPLYVHSAVGLGKTHLLQATAQAAIAQGRSVIYLTAEKFMYGFVAALQSQTAIAFKEALRSIDLLIFDDAQFLQGSKAIQNEFGHALNALVDSGRQVVVAADRPPGDLESLDERVRSRLAGGLCVEMTRAGRTAAGENPRGADRRGARAEPAFRDFAGRARLCRALDRLQWPRSRRRGQSPARPLDRRRAAAQCRRGGNRHPRPHPRQGAQAGEDRGHSKAGRRATTA